MDLLALFSFDATGWGDEILSGLGVTVSLALATIIPGLTIGLAVASASMSRLSVLRRIGSGYVIFFRGIPELLMLFLVYNGVGMLINAVANIINPGAGFVEFPPFLAGLVALSLIFGAYASEVLRGAFQALEVGQIEAARAIGMSPWQVFFRVRIPQVWRYALPGLGNLWINLIKDTALVSIIALNDLMRSAVVAVGFTKKPFVFYLAICLLYWLICVISELVVGALERRANRCLVRS